MLTVPVIGRTIATRAQRLGYRHEPIFGILPRRHRSCLCQVFTHSAGYYSRNVTLDDSPKLEAPGTCLMERKRCGGS